MAPIAVPFRASARACRAARLSGRTVRQSSVLECVDAGAVAYRHHALIQKNLFFAILIKTTSSDAVLTESQSEQLINAKNSEPTNPEKKPGRRPSSEPTFPVNTLTESLKIAEAMKKNYAGDPTDPIDIADLLDTTLNSSGFRNLLASSHRYGLTTGSYKAKKIVLTPLGKSIVESTNDEQKNQALVDALTKPPVFKKLLQKYDRKDFPKQEIIEKVLKNEFDIPAHRSEQCANVIIANVNKFNLIHQKTNILRLEYSTSTTIKHPTEAVESEDTDSDDTDEVNPEVIPKRPQNESTEIIPNVFISHSKNENILKQLKTMLEFGGYKYVIAKDIETTAIPIPENI